MHILGAMEKASFLQLQALRVVLHLIVMHVKCNQKCTMCLECGRYLLQVTFIQSLIITLENHGDILHFCYTLWEVFRVSQSIFTLWIAVQKLSLKEIGFGLWRNAVKICYLKNKVLRAFSRVQDFIVFSSLYRSLRRLPVHLILPWVITLWKITCTMVNTLGQRSLWIRVVIFDGRTRNDIQHVQIINNKLIESRL